MEFSLLSSSYPGPFDGAVHDDISNLPVTPRNKHPIVPFTLAPWIIVHPGRRFCGYPAVIEQMIRRNENSKRITKSKAVYTKIADGVTIQIEDVEFGSTVVHGE